MSYTKFCSNHFIRIELRANGISIEFEFAMENALVKWTPVHVYFPHRDVYVSMYVNDQPLAIKYMQIVYASFVSQPYNLL